jgi:predicted nucleotidyltransferase
MQLNSKQEQLQLLSQLINRGGRNKKEWLQAMLFPKKVLLKGARVFLQTLPKDEQTAPTKSVMIEIESCQTTHKTVLKLQKQLNSPDLKPYLYGAYLHGSLATNEEIAYSDLDALVILDQKAFASADVLTEVCYKLNQVSQLFYQYDPLQHHGWFVLTEDMLKEFPQIYFPPEIFKKSRSLFSDKGVELELKLDQTSKENFERPFIEICYSLKRNLKQGVAEQNAFKLKSIFSQFMLLPALYLQALNRKGIDKKQSFIEAPKHFTETEWEIMDQVSAIRQNWTYELNAWQRFWLTHPNYLIRKWGRRYAPKLKGELTHKVNELSINKMLTLIYLMEQKVKLEDGP